MNYYYIKPSVLAGNSFIVNDDIKSYYSKPSGFFSKGSIILEIDSFDYHDLLFTLHPYFFVTDELKKLLELSDLFDLTFQEIDFFIEGKNLIETKIVHGYSKECFWFISKSNGNDHFRFYENNLIVSEEALNFLLIHQAFKFKIFGSVYGKAFEWIDNLFQIRGTIESYFANHYQNDLRYVQGMETNLLEHYKLIK